MSKNNIHIVDEKIAVLEIEQQSHIDTNGNDKPELSFSFFFRTEHFLHDKKIYAREYKKDKNKFRRTPAIEEQTKNQNHKIFLSFSYQMVAQQKRREKIQKKKDATKNHVYSKCKTSSQNFKWIQ